MQRLFSGHGPRLSSKGTCRLEFHSQVADCVVWQKNLQAFLNLLNLFWMKSSKLQVIFGRGVGPNGAPATFLSMSPRS